MIYRWERADDSADDEQAMVLRADDERSQEEGAVAQYFFRRWHWLWMVTGFTASGAALTADDARSACELAVLHGAQP